MANPSPQHTPTDGLNVAAYVQVTGTNVATNSLGTLGSKTPGTTGTPLGQGTGAVSSANNPNAQYELTLSLSSATVNGVAYHTACQLTTVLKDVANTTYTPVGSPKYKSYGNPSAGNPSWFKPSNFSSTTAPATSYTADVVSVTSGGLITALALGQAVVEVQFPTFDNTETAEGETFDGGQNPNDMIYCQIIVNVIA